MAGVDGASRQGEDQGHVGLCAQSIGEPRPCRGLFYIWGALESKLDGRKRALTDGPSLGANFGHGVYGPLLRPPGRQEDTTGC